MKLAQSYAMTPTAVVSGFDLAHCERHDFMVGRIENDQVEGSARRNGWPVGEAERWPWPILNYET